MKQKNVFRGIVFIPFFNLLFFTSLFAQNPFWTFPEQGLDVPDFGIIPLPTDDYTGQEADYVHAGLKDPYGEIMFFMMDGDLYNAGGTLYSEFFDGQEKIKGTSEALVVPQPGSCNRFYIFQGRPAGGGESLDEAPYYSIYNDSLNRLQYESLENTFNLETNNLFRVGEAQIIV